MMYTKYYSKAIRYQKAMSDNAFSLLSVVQNNSDAILRKTLEQANWMPDSGKKGYLLFSDGCLRTTANLKSMVDKGYEEAERLFTQPEKKTASKQKAKTASTKAGTTTSGTNKAASKKTPAKKTTATKTTTAKTSSATKKTKAEGGTAPTTETKQTPAEKTGATAKPKEPAKSQTSTSTGKTTAAKNAKDSKTPAPESASDTPKESSSSKPTTG